MPVFSQCITLPTCKLYDLIPINRQPHCQKHSDKMKLKNEIDRAKRKYYTGKIKKKCYIFLSRLKQDANLRTMVCLTVV